MDSREHIPAYLLPNPSALERSLARRLSGGRPRTMTWGAFPDGEISMRLKGEAPLRACVIGRTGPAPEQVFRTALCMDTLRRHGCSTIIAVVPYFAYGRQDRAVRPGDPVTGNLVTRMLAEAGASRIVTADLHSDRLAESSPLPFESVTLVPELAKAYAHRGARAFTVVAPDEGAKDAALLFAGRANAKWGWFEKRRLRSGAPKIGQFQGDIEGSEAVIVDDMVSTGGTVVAAVSALRRLGFSRFSLCVTHPVFAAGAVSRLKKAGIRRLVVSDTRPIPTIRGMEVTVVSAAPVLAAAVEGTGA